MVPAVSKLPVRALSPTVTTTIAATRETSTILRCIARVARKIYCRFDSAFEGSVVLELAATKEGPSASLTYEYSDPKGAELLDIASGFFRSVGVDAKSLAHCIRQSHTVSSDMNVGDLTLSCRYADLGTHVTYEVFAYRRASPSPMLLAGSDDPSIRDGE